MHIYIHIYIYIYVCIWVRFDQMFEEPLSSTKFSRMLRERRSRRTTSKILARMPEGFSSKMPESLTTQWRACPGVNIIMTYHATRDYGATL